MTLHPDELTDGYRRRIRKSGKCPDKSKVIEKISQQQEKRGKMKSRAKACFKHALLYTDHGELGRSIGRIVCENVKR